MDSLIGEKLKKIRSEKGISLEQVSRKTKIHLSLLEALEENRLINKAPIYVKGYIKIYCDFLGVDPGEFIDNYQKSGIKKEGKPQRETILPGPSIKLVKFQPGFNIAKIVVIIVVLLAIVGIFKIVKVARRPKPLAAGADLAVAKKIKPSEAIRLSVRARDNCWIKAKVDERIIFTDILKKGRSETWQAQDKIELSLGNAGGIELELNGEIISPLGRKGQVVKQILITKEGLKIIR